MKILAYIIRHKGGVGRVMRTVAPELVKLGHEVQIISREDDLGCFSLKSSIIKINKDIKNRDYDILLTNDWSIAIPFLHKKNHFTLFHGMEQHIKSKVLQYFVGKITGKNLMVVGPKLHSKFPSSNLTENGIDATKFFDMKKERKYLGWIKRDYDEVTEIEVEVIAHLRGMKLSIAENIHPDKMNEWYNSLEVFLSMPPAYTGFNLCWVEAYRAGVPIILGNDNGIGINNIRNEDLTAENQARKIHEVITR